MPYGVIKVDQVTFTNAGVDQTISVSGIVASISGNITATGTISGDVIRGGTLVSGATVTGTAGQFGTITGNAAAFTTVTGTTVTGTTANFVTVSGTTVTGNVGQFGTITGNTAGFTTVTGTTVTGVTATFTSGVFTNISGGTHTITSGVFALGSASNPSISFTSDPNTGIYSAGADQLSIATNGTERLRIDSAGQIEAVSLGTAAAPTWSFTGDPNTGIYSPGADQLAISTNGTGRLFVDASGNAGFGLTSPERPIHLPDGSVLLLGTTAATGTQIQHTASANFLINNKEAGAQVFYTSDTERLRITSDGKVGLGTSAPDVDFHVSNADTATIRLENRDTTGSVAQSIGVIQFEGNDGAAGAAGIRANINAVYEGVDGATALAFGTSADGASLSEKVRIDRNGRVGVGTTSPGAILHTVNTSAGAATVGAFIQNSSLTAGTEVRLGFAPNTNLVSDNRYSWIAGVNDTGSNGSSLTFATTPGGQGATEKMRIDGSGRLLVGTSSTSTDTLFRVQGKQSSSASNGVVQIARGQINPSSDNGLGHIQFTDAAGSIGASIIGETELNWSANDYPSRLIFATTADNASSPTERLRITSAGVLQVADAGNIAVGTTTGTKIGTATTQKLGFFNATPVVQPTAVANATDAASVITQLNALLTRMRNLGLIAT